MDFVLTLAIVLVLCGAWITGVLFVAPIIIKTYFREKRANLANMLNPDRDSKSKGE